MTTQEIQQHIDAVISAKFEDYTSESGEIMTSPKGDGRFMGKVIATRYSGLPTEKDIFLAIGESEKKVQVVKLGRSECLTPIGNDLDLMLQKELGIELPE